MKCWKCSCDLLPCQNKSVLHKLTFFIAPRNKRHHLNFPATDRVQATDHTPSEPRPEEHFQESRHADSHPWDEMITLRNSCLERMFTLRPAAAPALPHQGWAPSWCSRSTLRWSAPSRGSASALSGTTAWCGRQRTRTPQQLSLQMWTDHAQQMLTKRVTLLTGWYSGKNSKDKCSPVYTGETMELMKSDMSELDLHVFNTWSQFVCNWAHPGMFSIIVAKK